jgi:dTDP-4-amino-4,6-dideoxygalactose transaminase
MIPFSPPRIDEAIIEEVAETLRSGWISTGPRTLQLEDKITEWCGHRSTVCLNSATAGLKLLLDWMKIGPGDEVIIPAYTYCATANVVVQAGAKPVMVDVNPEDFNINPQEILKALTLRTKVIMPVDLGGMPVDYDALLQIATQAGFSPNNEIQEKLGRIAIIADAAHSIGATYKGKKAGTFCELSSFSFHAVKNLTTAEGGSVNINLPEVFDAEALRKALKIKSLHGQSKDALTKMQIGGWRYDVTEAGYKCNMTDINAAIGLVEIARYEQTLKRRKEIFDLYTEILADYDWAQVPVYETEKSTSSYHLYLMRIKGISEGQRDEIIRLISADQIAVNVHYLPLPMLSYYNQLGYKMTDYPVAYDNYSREISLPVFYNLTNTQVEQVCVSLINAVKKTIG